MKAWVYQDRRQVARHGADQAAWYVGWVDPLGRRRCKSCGPGPRGRQLAQRLADKRHAELVAGTYDATEAMTFAAFVDQYDRRILASKSVSHQLSAHRALIRFARITGVKRLKDVATRHIDQFVAARRVQRGKRPGDEPSPCTINLELRNLKAAFRVAVEWGLLADAPKIRMLRAPKKLPVYVTPEHFSSIYQACGAAHLPCPRPGDWWRAFLGFAYLTGWRLGEILSLRRDDVDFDSGHAITRAESNKARTDAVVALHPAILAHLRGLDMTGEHVFYWPHHRRTIYDVFATIQQAAGINLPCRARHSHTPTCHLYSFHDLRRAFATLNATRLSADALQQLMRHQSYQTTKVYIAMARQMDEAVARLYVPDVFS